MFVFKSIRNKANKLHSCWLMLPNCGSLQKGAFGKEVEGNCKA